MHAIMLTDFSSSDHTVSRTYFSRTSKNAGVYSSSTWFVFHSPDFLMVSCGDKACGMRSLLGAFANPPWSLLLECGFVWYRATVFAD